MRLGRGPVRHAPADDLARDKVQANPLSDGIVEYGADGAHSVGLTALNRSGRGLALPGKQCLPAQAVR